MFKFATRNCPIGLHAHMFGCSLRGFVPSFFWPRRSVPCASPESKTLVSNESGQATDQHPAVRFLPRSGRFVDDIFNLGRELRVFAVVLLIQLGERKRLRTRTPQGRKE